MTSVRSRRASAAVAAAVVLSGQFSLADTATSQWTGAASTTWSGTGNWASGVPSASVGSLFDGTFSTMPTLGANQASLGLWLKTGVGQDVVINADVARTLTLTAGATLNNVTGITSFPGTAILMDDSANHNLTFGPNVALVTGDSTAIINNSAGTLTIQGSIARSWGNGLAFAGNNAAGVIDISGGLVNSGGGNFRVNTAGTVILSGDSSSYTSTFQNYGGTVRLTNVNALKAAAVTLGTSSGTTFLQLHSDNDQDTFISSGSLNVRNEGSTINVDRLTAAGGSNKTLKLAKVNVDNNGKLTLTGGNGYGLSIGALTLGNGNTSTTTLNPTSASMTIGSVVPIQPMTNGRQFFALDGTTAGNSVTGVISDNSANVNYGTAVRKQNTSTWTLSGANTYSGGTTVSAGTLFVNNAAGSGTGSGAVDVNGGILGGNGTIAGPVTITSGGLAPGNSAGKLSFGSSLGLGGTTTMEIIGASRGVDGGYDAIDVTGAMTYGGALVVNFAAPATSQGYNLFDFASFTAGSKFTSITLTGAYAGALTDPTNSGTWQGSFGGGEFTFTRSDGVLNVAIPEPGTVALALGAIGLGCMRRQRRPL